MFKQKKITKTSQPNNLKIHTLYSLKIKQLNIKTIKIDKVNIQTTFISY